MDELKYKSLEPVFWARVAVKSDEDCWLWLGPVDQNGYGLFSKKGKALRASRFSWALANKKDPEDLFVCHSCDTPTCVNPGHLWLGTAKENTHDSIRKGRFTAMEILPFTDRRGEKNGMSKLTEKIVKKIRREYKRGKIKQIDLAKSYGVTQVTISRIILRQFWKHV